MVAVVKTAGLESASALKGGCRFLRSIFLFTSGGAFQTYVLFKPPTKRLENLVLRTSGAFSFSALLQWPFEGHFFYRLLKQVAIFGDSYKTL